MRVIGITGTLGAGKGTIVDYLVREQGYKHYSVRAYLIEEIQKRGLNVNRDTMTAVANDIRKNNSPSFIIEELYKKASLGQENAIIESIRTPGEVEFLKKRGNFVLIAVDAEPKLRYERIVIRGSSTDNVSFNTFIENERREYETRDPNKQNLSYCIEKADIRLLNNGSIENLISQFKKEMNNI